jgi:hypothetical protein
VEQGGPGGKHQAGVVIRMKRREVIMLFGGAAVAWPIAARAQPSRMPLVGVLRPNPKDIIESFAEPLRRSTYWSRLS